MNDLIRTFLSFRSLGICFLVLLPCLTLAQEDQAPSDTGKVKKTEKKSFKVRFLGSNPHSPTIAGGLSLLLPGAGQIYNKKYWKAPVVWGLGALVVYQYRVNNQGFKEYDAKYLETVDSTTNVGNLAFRSVREDYRRNRDLFLILGGILYTVNFIDAVVDAHLYQFKINENLIMSVKPDASSTFVMNNTIGLKLQFNLR